ncbi:hypothetical protein CMU55_19395 [Elizabethkingia anophelis]|nr:hypothetical protein [Elizabethkingia anophelis]
MVISSFKDLGRFTDPTPHDFSFSFDTEMGKFIVVEKGSNIDNFGFGEKMGELFGEIEIDKIIKGADKEKELLNLLTVKLGYIIKLNPLRLIGVMNSHETIYYNPIVYKQV